jgi:thymidylate synthase
MAFKTMVTELLWFLRGDTNIKYLVDNGCHIWDGDAYKNYTKSFLGYEDIPSQEWFINEIKTNPDFANRFGDLGPIYGKQWRKWYGWRKHSLTDQIANLINELKANPYLSLMWNQRSVDTFLGLPFNIASYGLLLEILAKEVNMIPDELIGNLGDVHLYSNHIEQAKEQIGREPFELPKLTLEHSGLDPVELVYKLEDYQSHPSIKAPLSN